MSSEAAQKAYPEEEYGKFHDFGRGDLLDAFIHGGVEALRQAAAKARAGFAPDACPWAGFLDDLADEWERGSA